MDEQILYKAHPAMFRNNPVGFVVSVILIAAFGLGLVILLIWWLRVLGTTLVVTNERITLRKGILSRNINEVYHTDVRNVQVNQTFFQRVLGVGAIGVASAGHGGVEIYVEGIRDPDRVMKIISQYRRQKDLKTDD